MEGETQTRFRALDDDSSYFLSSMEKNLAFTGFARSFEKLYVCLHSFQISARMQFAFRSEVDCGELNSEVVIAMQRKCFAIALDLQFHACGQGALHIPNRTLYPVMRTMRLF